jgi:hypothetical protein
MLRESLVSLDLRQPKVRRGDQQRCMIDYSMARSYSVPRDYLSYASKWRRAGSTLPSWCFMFGGPSDLRDIPSTTQLDVYGPHPITSMVRPARLVSEDSVLVVKGRIVDVVCVSRNPLASFSQASLLTPEVAKIGEPDQRLEVTKFVDEGEIPAFLSSLLDLLPEESGSQDLKPLFYTIFAWSPWSLSISDHKSAEETTAFQFWVYLQDWKLREKKRFNCLEHAISIMENYCSQLGGTVDKLSESNGEKTQSMREQAMRRLTNCTLKKGRVLGALALIVCTIPCKASRTAMLLWHFKGQTNFTPCAHAEICSNSLETYTWTA